MYRLAVHDNLNWHIADTNCTWLDCCELFQYKCSWTGDQRDDVLPHPTTTDLNLQGGLVSHPTDRLAINISKMHYCCELKILLLLQAPIKARHKLPRHRKVRAIVMACPTPSTLCPSCSDIPLAITTSVITFLTFFYAISAGLIYYYGLAKSSL